MLIQFLILYIGHSLYLLEKKSDKLFINLEGERKVVFKLQGLVSYIQNENTYEYCPIYEPGCTIFIKRSTTEDEIKKQNANKLEDEINSSQFEIIQLKYNIFKIYDLEIHSYNNEIFSFLHEYNYEDSDNFVNIFIMLSPLSSNFNSFVYFGYSLCISEQDGYLKTNQNELLIKNKLNMKGISSQFQIHGEVYVIKISYMQYSDKVIDISNYRIVLYDEDELIYFPYELMIRLYNGSFNQQFRHVSFEDSEYTYFIRQSLPYNVETLQPLQFYNFKDQPLLVMPEDYIIYNYNQSKIDQLTFVTHNKSDIIFLGKSFLKRKIINYCYLSQEIFIEQLQEEKCISEISVKDSFYFQLVYKIILFIIMSIFVYAIFRKLRAQSLLKKQNKLAQQALILRQEVELLK